METWQQPCQMGVVCSLAIVERANLIHTALASLVRQLRNCQSIIVWISLYLHLLLLLGHHLPLGEEDFEVEEENQEQGDEEGPKRGVHNVA